MRNAPLQPSIGQWKYIVERKIGLELCKWKMSGEFSSQGGYVALFALWWIKRLPYGMRLARWKSKLLCAGGRLGEISLHCIADLPNGRPLMDHQEDRLLAMKATCRTMWRQVNGSKREVYQPLNWIFELWGVLAGHSGFAPLCHDVQLRWLWYECLNGMIEEGELGNLVWRNWLTPVYSACFNMEQFSQCLFQIEFLFCGSREIVMFYHHNVTLVLSTHETRTKYYHTR